MSGLYNVIFGENKKAKFLWDLLKLDDYEVGRYRDLYVTETYIVLHTRNGGGNRDGYKYAFDSLSTHPLYAYDEDNDWDCTYADIYFKYPEGYEELLSEMAKGTLTPSEKWKTLFEALEKKS